MTARLEVFLDGEWKEVQGVVSVNSGDVQYDVNPPAPEPDSPVPELEITLVIRTAHVEEAFANAGEAFRRLCNRFPRVIDQDGNPVRPAWQSPCRPRPRRC
ncbi:hypothetical protein ACWEQC_06840 [Streptomyces shenzhenensis]